MADTDHDSTQHDKFRQLARELECDEDEAAFEDKVRKVAKSLQVSADRPGLAKSVDPKSPD